MSLYTGATRLGRLLNLPTDNPDQVEAVLHAAADALANLLPEVHALRVAALHAPATPPWETLRAVAQDEAAKLGRLVIRITTEEERPDITTQQRRANAVLVAAVTLDTRAVIADLEATADRLERARS